MPLSKIQFRPGVNRETTSYGSENSWYNSDLIRFRKGRPEKMGGWETLSGNTPIGITRSLHTWGALDGAKYMGLGTQKKFYIENGGIYNDITPIRTTVTLGANPLKTGSAASGVVTVTAIAHGAMDGDFVTFSGATTTDGITAAQFNTEHELTLVDSNSYTIDTDGSASSGSTTGGGSAIIASYQLNVGLDIEVSGLGFGSGLWGGISSGYTQTTLNDSGGINDSVTSFRLTSATDFETAASTVSAAVNLNASSLSLASSTSFPNKGTVLIGSEKIRYATNVANVLGTLIRGTDGTTAAYHSSGTAITFVGLIQIDDELIQYTGKSSNTIDAGVVRGVRGTTAISHSDGVNVLEANDSIGWGGASVISTTTKLRLWFQDNWGEDLFFCAIDDTPYYWDKTLGVGNRATTFASQTGASDTPTITRKIMISGTDRHIICLGCNPLNETAQDLLQVRWSDQESPFDWTPSAVNTAGGQRISAGSEIIAAQRTRQEILIWTDVNLHAMRFVGAPFTFGFSLLASNTSLIGPNALVSVGDRTFWMDQENFYAYVGRIEVVPCTVLRYIFDDINLDQANKIFAASNKMFDEIFWFYVSSNADPAEIDRYVKFNYTENTWDIGTLSRTAWVDSGVYQYPRATEVSNGNSVIYQHELGNDDNGSAMTSFVESADFDVGDGDQFMFIKRLVPDIDITSSAGNSVDYILKTRNFPGDSLTTNSTNSVSSTTQQAFIRARTRQAVIRVESSSTDISWTLGDLRLDAKPDGRR